MSKSEKTESAHVVEFDANKHDVSAVTVFQSNRAEIRRNIKVSLKNGQNELEVKNLPTCLEEDSIRVDGIGNAVIFDVIYHPPIKVDSKKHDDALGDLKKKRAALDSDLDILKRQAEVLKDYSKTLSGKDTTSAQLDDFLDIFASRQRKVNEGVTQLQEEIRVLDKSIQETSVNFSADDESMKKRGVKVTIIVLAQGDGDAELSLTYIVLSASWTPQYDLRAAIAKDEKSKTSVNLHYRASISQATGENWNGVDLRLSTASPLQGTAIPSLSPYWIGEEARQQFYKSKKKSVSVLPSMPSFGASSPQYDFPPADFERTLMRSAVVMDSIQEAPPNFFSGLDSVASEGALSTTFAIPGLSTIPSDSESSAQTHKVSIAEIELSSVDLDWITVPRHTASAFLRCTVKNTSQYVLLPGKSNVFMNGNFVAKSTIPHVSPQEFFKCSLGVDPAVRVTYHPLSSKTKSGGSVLTTRSTTTFAEQRISVKNTRLTPIKSLIIKDQIPLARDAKFKINLVEPAFQPKHRYVQVKPGVSAKWTTNGDANVDDAASDSGLLMKDESKERESGMLDWLCSVKAGENVEVSMAWEVVAPAGVKWVRQ